MAFRAQTDARRAARKHLAIADAPDLGSAPSARSCIVQELARERAHMDEVADQSAEEDDENWCAAAITSLGFDVELVTRTLEENEFSFARTLSYFMNGMDYARDVARFRRHTRKKVVCAINLEKVANPLS